MEKALHRLHAPTWPADILGPIDQSKAKRGREQLGRAASIAKIHHDQSLGQTMMAIRYEYAGRCCGGL